MTYNPNIPQANDNPSLSQGQMLTNFGQINTLFGTNLTTGAGGDHTLLDSAINQGHHNRITFIDQSIANAVVKQAGANQVLLYGKTVSGVTTPYYTRNSIPVGTTEWPVSPIKAYASFITIVSAGGISNITPDDSFNINTPIVQNFAGLPTTYTVTMTNACRTMVYGILITADLNGATILGQVGYTIVSQTEFIIKIPFNVALLPARRITVSVLES